MPLGFRPIVTTPPPISSCVKLGICGRCAPMTGPIAKNIPASTAPVRRLTPESVKPTKMAMLKRKSNSAAPTVVLSPP